MLAHASEHKDKGANWDNFSKGNVHVANTNVTCKHQCHNIGVANTNVTFSDVAHLEPITFTDVDTAFKAHAAKHGGVELGVGAIVKRGSPLNRSEDLYPDRRGIKSLDISVFDDAVLR